MPTDATHLRTASLARHSPERVEGRSRALVFDTATNGNALTLTLNAQAVTDLATKAVEQSISIVRRRIDETGVNEPVVARQGQDRVLVELPGVSDPDRIKRLLGSTCKNDLPSRRARRHGRRPRGGAAAHGQQSRGRGEDARPSPYRGRRHEPDARHRRRTQRSGGWVVNFGLDSIGTRRFADVSTKHVGQPFAIVLDNKVISAPVIREPIIGGQGQISGNFSVEEANDLAVLLRAGALPAPSPSSRNAPSARTSGADAIRSGLYSIIAGFTLVVGFMIATYGRFGLFAAAALVVNLALTIAGLSMMGATLTLPGMAGILLALGMAVDANILINERTREELGKRNGVIASIEAGVPPRLHDDHGRQRHDADQDADPVHCRRRRHPRLCRHYQPRHPRFDVHGHRPRSPAHLLVAAARAPQDADHRHALPLLPGSHRTSSS